ncbi:MAG: membrane protein insertase YidC [Acidobacteriota bacterium]|nr:membrane protein insertase YidC [Acidobacteriota bacterium]
MAEFKNPGQQGGQDNNSLLVMMLVMVMVFLGMQYFRNRNAAPAGHVAAPAAASSTATPAPVATGNASAPAGAAPVVQAAAATTTVVENDLVRITFSNRGGVVTSWQLKKVQGSDGKPLDLVHAQAAEHFGYPLSVYTYDPTQTAALNQAMYVASATASLAAPATLSFKYSDGATQVTKTFHLDETYVLHAELSVTHNGAPLRALLSWPAGLGDQDNVQAYNGGQIDTMSDGKVDHLAAKKVTGGDTLSGPFDWAGVSDPYFAAVFLPDHSETATVATLHNQLDVAKTIRRTGMSAPSSKGPVLVNILGAAIGDTSGTTDVRVFAGPKAISVLRAVHAANPKVTLEPILEFGFFGWIGKYLFLALQFIHAHVTLNWAGSWGWAIILLTIFINLLLLPLRVKTMQSGLKMQRIQPQMDAIKEKYKKYKVTDPKRNEMNAEIMQLQKDNGVNMFGGCIPTLIQLPLLFAFFAMLPKVVELRQAHWFWLPDLTAADPYHILPILMIVSQFLVQFYTPSPGVDPQQQKMMAFMMPAFSGYLTWNYASGLALYWSVGNLIGIIQQAVMNRTSLGREMREIAARRARRKSGTTIQGRR